MFQTTDFRELCHRHGLAATHQRQVIYQTVLSLSGHPSPESIYAKVRTRIPSISLATVYKNLRTFLDSGMLREVSLHHGTLRIESNQRPHHHVVCVTCKSIEDLHDGDSLPPRLRSKLPRGFRVQRVAMDIVGVCATCSAKNAGSPGRRF